MFEAQQPQSGTARCPPADDASQNVVLPHTGASLSCEKEGSLTLTTMWVDPENTMLREADTEGHTGWDFIDGKRPEPADLLTQRVDEWLLGAGKGVSRERVCFSFSVFFFIFWSSQEAYETLVP